MDFVPIVGASLVVAGLIFFIFHNAIKTANYKRRALCFLIFGIVLMAGFAYGIYDDIKTGKLTKFTIEYLALPITILAFTVIFVLVNFLSANRYNHHIRSYKSLVDKSKAEYLYLLFKYENNYLLDFDNEYKGIIIKFDNNVYFYDEMIEKVIKRYAIDMINKRFCGKITTNQNKKKSIYYCYEIEVKALNDELMKYKPISKYEIANASIPLFHKNVIFRMLLNEQFIIDE